MSSPAPTTPNTKQGLRENVIKVLEHKTLDESAAFELIDSYYQQLLSDTQAQADKHGFYAGQANAGVSLEDCHKNYGEWVRSDE